TLFSRIIHHRTVSTLFPYTTLFRSIDENLTGNDRIFGTLTHFNNQSPSQPRIAGPLENNVGPGMTTGYQATIGYTRTWTPTFFRSEEHTSELQSPCNLVCRLLLEKN